MCFPFWAKNRKHSLLTESVCRGSRRITANYKQGSYPPVRFGTALAPYSDVLLGFGGWTVHLLSAVHELAWTQYPVIWLCGSCAILWLVIRSVRSPWVGTSAVLVLFGLMLNGAVTAANAGTMPVVGMPATLHPVSPLWQAATSQTRLAFLADRAGLGLFSVGDLLMFFGGILLVAICLHRVFRKTNSPSGCAWSGGLLWQNSAFVGPAA